MSNLSTVLNKQLANWIVTEMKLRSFHWHVSGPQFFTLHAKFEELYNEAAEHIDTLAERLLAIGGKALPTLTQALQLASVQEEPGALAAEQMVAAVANDFGLLIEELKVGQAFADSAEDDVTADLLQDIRAGLEKHVWMLKAFLA